ncbi:MAG: four helix bundle protein [Candidatus Staskawiczbacteria bacterium RIFOXYC1_FULL_37_43]|nr:MAG: four helix bundle protein [Candidatus Staskawiczbacteria bacterium RIFCSPHIGHO2_01_FULL_37_17]OGZ71622.1 MAG: four helix bundle protein [Candidatus Staskawiczbacteria bacterium RIFCSPLOWO2_01_FULL_37_19]OGZ76389.1 MAG: four helix bundle protein [Candidatus Staskawiczbacteria bacterium RIFOXYA1_FULL_37_15]OGZ77805.1 MAG: four helix bundle protein [Candidatus Staskawiczbacteria bacterium RIFOXYA12_FULL_37_10]OGZ80406.1 MAG: four helix bundle protein [Candidatus Staskawiczbacteria bacteriu
MESYENLIVWQKSMDLVILVYELTQNFPKEEIYGLVSQMRRASVSIPSNIAEGSRRSSRKDFRNFLLNAYGSGAELETQIKIAKRLQFSKKEIYPNIEDLLCQIMRMLNKLTKELKD